MIAVGSVQSSSSTLPSPFPPPAAHNVTSSAFPFRAPAQFSLPCSTSHATQAPFAASLADNCRLPSNPFAFVPGAHTPPKQPQKPKTQRKRGKKTDADNKTVLTSHSASTATVSNVPPPTSMTSASESTSSSSPRKRKPALTIDTRSELVKALEDDPLRRRASPVVSGKN